MNKKPLRMLCAAQWADLSCLFLPVNQLLDSVYPADDRVDFGITSSALSSSDSEHPRILPHVLASRFRFAAPCPKLIVHVHSPRPKLTFSNK